MIPTLDMARLFTKRGVKATIVTTAHCAARFYETIERDRELGVEISTTVIKFPSAEAARRM